MPYAAIRDRGGRAAAAGINRLPRDQLGRFIDAYGRNTPEVLRRLGLREFRFNPGKGLHDLGVVQSARVVSSR